MVPVLALAPHRSTTAALLGGAARERGIEVTVLPGDGVPGPLRAEGGGAHYYGGPRFATGVTGPLGCALLEPDEGWLDNLPYEFTGRGIRRVPLSEARRAAGPAFVKPPTDKSFPAAVYGHGGALDVGAEGDPLVQISEVVVWKREFRLHLLDGEIRTGSRYATFGRLDAAPLEGHPDEPGIRAFVRRLSEQCGDTLPSGVVVDVGWMRGPGGRGGEQWAVVEANMAWFSNVYAADPARALDVVLRSAGPRTAVRAGDRRFCRT